MMGLVETLSLEMSQWSWSISKNISNFAMSKRVSLVHKFSWGLYIGID